MNIEERMAAFERIISARHGLESKRVVMSKFVSIIECRPKTEEGQLLSYQLTAFFHTKGNVQVFAHSTLKSGLWGEMARTWSHPDGSWDVTGSFEELDTAESVLEFIVTMAEGDVEIKAGERSLVVWNAVYHLYQALGNPASAIIARGYSMQSAQLSSGRLMLSVRYRGEHGKRSWAAVSAEPDGKLVGEIIWPGFDMRELHWAALDAMKRYKQARRVV